jgi:hypothetical protein
VHVNRASALADALRENGCVCEVDHDVVTLAAPRHTEARVFVGADVDGYLCSFVASPGHERGVRGSIRAWAEWTASVRRHVAEAWPTLEPLEIPEAKPVEPAPLEIPEAKPVEPAPLEIRYEHEYPLWSPVDDALVHAYQGATRERRFVVVREWRAWGSGEDGGYDAPRVTWHAWAAETAVELGAAKGWESIAGASIDAGHPAAKHVQRVLVEAAKRAEPPRGVVALDVRGLPLDVVEAFVRVLVEAASGRLAQDDQTRGAILLCDSRTAVYLWRSVPLDFS